MWTQTFEICLGGWKIDRLEREQSVLELLKDLRGLEPLKKLFWSELNYDRINQPLSRRGWNQAATNALDEDPVLFAGGGQNNDFHVIYSQLTQDRLLLGQERPVVNQLLREHPYGLFVFSNLSQDHWHFINVKYDAETEKRRLFRRISISPEDRLRTASERLSKVDLESIQADLFGLSPLAIQQRHDEAFDVEAVTDQFFKEGIRFRAGSGIEPAFNIHNFDIIDIVCFYIHHVLSSPYLISKNCYNSLLLRQ